MLRLTLSLIALVVALPAAAQRLEGISEAPPALPEGATPMQPVPAHHPQGGFVTPNRDLSPEAAVWHVRAALNVAALGCRDAEESATVAGYNRLIRVHRERLGTLDAMVKAQYRSRFGKDWEDAHDQAMTRVYNFFAQVPAHQGFCDAAHQVLRESATVTPEAFPDFARAALPRLEAPFTDFYQRVESWRIAYAAWQQRGSAPVLTAALPTPLRTLIP